MDLLPTGASPYLIAAVWFAKEALSTIYKVSRDYLAARRDNVGEAEPQTQGAWQSFCKQEFRVISDKISDLKNEVRELKMDVKLIDSRMDNFNDSHQECKGG